MRLSLFAAVIVTSLSMLSSAFAGEIEVTSAWTRATLPGAKVAGGFAMISNSGRTADRLVGVSSPVAAKAELHTMKMVDDVMVMRPMEGGLMIPAGGSAELKPGGDHLMLMGLAEGLKEGDKVPVTLKFESGSEIGIELMVMPANAKEMKHGGHKHGEHKHSE
ncbi:MAG: copper chaperone PCu(A)C [Rhizobiaceae bacterium]